MVKSKKLTKKDKKILYINITISLITLLICFLTVFIYINYIFKKPVKEVKEIVLNREISDGVDRVYNSIVTVENYIADKLYSTGTGFVYKKDNEKIYIVTNHHVIDSANEIYVIFPNDLKYKTKVIGYDEYQDVAVLSIPLNDTINEVLIGSSKDMKIGDTTFVVGTPINQKAYSFTVTKGILSGKDRLVEYSFDSQYRKDETNYIKVLQTDAAINSGNSGGALCNLDGEVIGVINLKISSDNVEGIGFAIPIEDVVIFADKIIKGEPIVRPSLPFSYEDIIIDDKELVKVRTINKDNEEKYNIKEDDIIKKIDKEDVKNSSYLKYLINNRNVGDIIEIVYERIEKDNDNNEIKNEFTINITLEK